MIFAVVRRPSKASSRRSHQPSLSNVQEAGNVMCRRVSLHLLLYDSLRRSLTHPFITVCVSRQRSSLYDDRVESTVPSRAMSSDLDGQLKGKVHGSNLTPARPSPPYLDGDTARFLRHRTRLFSSECRGRRNRRKAPPAGLGRLRRGSLLRHLFGQLFRAGTGGSSTDSHTTRMPVCGRPPPAWKMRLIPIR